MLLMFSGRAARASHSTQRSAVIVAHSAQRIALSATQHNAHSGSNTAAVETQAVFYTLCNTHNARQWEKRQRRWPAPPSFDTHAHSCIAASADTHAIAMRAKANATQCRQVNGKLAQRKARLAVGSYKSGAQFALRRTTNFVCFPFNKTQVRNTQINITPQSSRTQNNTNQAAHKHIHKSINQSIILYQAKLI